MSQNYNNPSFGPPGSSYGQPPPYSQQPQAPQYGQQSAPPPFGQPPLQQQYGMQPQQYGQAPQQPPAYNQPGQAPQQPPAYNQQSLSPQYAQPPQSQQYGQSFGAPPASNFPGSNLPPSNLNPPPSVSASNPSTGFPTNSVPPSGKPMFFSTASGVPVPAVPVSSVGPGPSIINMPPPSLNAGGLTMPPPPSGFGQPPNVPMMQNAGTAPPGTMYGGVIPGPTAIPRAASMTGMPLGFDSGSNLSSIPTTNQPGNPNNPADINNPNAQANVANQGAPLPLIEEMDLSIQCNPLFLRPTVTKIVGNQAAANTCKIPLGLVCKPMAGDTGTENDEIEVVDFGQTGIVRCKRCRTYINPYVTWADNGRRWRCNICGMLNDVPSTYFSHLDNNGQRRDKDQRPELSRCSVEFVAPGDYMVRPPQAPVYFFVVDVSENAIQSGMLHSMVNAIKQSLDDLPGSTRTQIGFITFDSHIHFYNLNAKLASPQMLVVSDFTDVVLPLPEDLLVNLSESRNVVNSLLDSLPSMFKSNSNSGNCMGPALIAAKRVIQHIGGKLLLFQSSLPLIGEGALKNRENPRMLGSDKEHMMLNPDEQWYKTNSIDFSRLQICVDTFLFSPQYTDLASISVLAKYTAGSTYYYPAFSNLRDGPKFESDLKHNLLRATAFEAVMRVRATRGLRFSNFYGNYYVRGTDLLALPTCSSDSTFSLDIAYDEVQLSAQAITIQAALLYTSSAGERRIRVHTMLIPVTQSVTEMVDSFDIDCAMNIISKQAIDIAQKTGMENARQRVNQATVDIMKAARTINNPVSHQQQPHQYGMQPMQPSQVSNQSVTIPSSLLLLPLYSMSVQKNVIVRGGTDTRLDERAYFQQLVQNMDIEETKVFIYPRMFSIHDMSNDVGFPSDNADDDIPTAGMKQVCLPSILNLSYERLSSDGIFLLENGHDMFMWIGRNVKPAIINTLFGYQSLDGIDMMSLRIIPENSDFSSRVNEVIQALREDRSRYMQIHFIKEGDGYAEAYFARYLIEDRANFSGGGLSYTEYHSHVTRSVSGLPG